VVVPHPPRWFHRALAWLIFVVARIVTATIRFKWVYKSPQAESPKPGPVIYCTWHNRLALCMPLYEQQAKKRNHTAGMAVMVSASKDGAFLAAVLERFGVEPVRGSSSRRGPQALLELTSWAECGHDLAITPDGPRGPRYSVQDGVMSLAQLTGLTIIPASYHTNWKWVIKSWDRFQIPLPFAVCTATLEKPISVPREATDAEREALRLELEKRMNEMTKD
jgi:lysophospholipid acyltransferase (LPLAT)-like uncharacterized protein